jgi:hypothetical protein
MNNRQQEDEPAVNLVAVGLRHISDEAWQHLLAQDDARARDNLVPHGPGPLHVRIVQIKGS